MNSLRTYDIKYLKGVGPRRAELLKKELGIATGYDLVRHYPTHYLDRSKVYTIKELNDDMPYVQIRGRFVTFNTIGEGAKMRLVGLFSDGTATLEVVWFRRIKAIRESLTTGTEYVVFGKPSSYMGSKQMSHPEIDLPNSAAAMQPVRGVYPLTERLRSANITSRQIASWISTLLGSRRTIVDPLPQSVIADIRLMPLGKALAEIHNPSDAENLRQARLRLKFDELIYIQVDMLRR